MTKQELIKEINEFVGKDGYVPFEHGYRPTINAYAVGYGYISLRSTHKDLPFEEMDEVQLQNVLNELFKYLNYCHNEA